MSTFKADLAGGLQFLKQCGAIQMWVERVDKLVWRSRTWKESSFNVTQGALNNLQAASILDAAKSVSSKMMNEKVKGKGVDTAI